MGLTHNGAVYINACNIKIIEMLLLLMRLIYLEIKKELWIDQRINIAQICIGANDITQHYANITHLSTLQIIDLSLSDLVLYVFMYIYR